MQGGLFGHDDENRTKLLIKHGFIKEDEKGNIVADEEITSCRVVNPRVPAACCVTGHLVYATPLLQVDHDHHVR